MSFVGEKGLSNLFSLDIGIKNKGTLRSKMIKLNVSIVTTCQLYRSKKRKYANGSKDYIFKKSFSRLRTNLLETRKVGD